MKRDGVELTPQARTVACAVMVKALKFHGVEVIALCVGKKHSHALIKCPKKKRNGKSLGTAVPRLWRNRIARHFMGIAKKESARALSKAALAQPGGVWAGGCGVKPIKDRRHHVRVVKYIHDHKAQGAVVWLWMMD
jgi:REP element-mobilizing transposase RayT